MILIVLKSINKKNVTIVKIDDCLSAVAKLLASVSQVVDTIPTQDTYLYEPELIIPDLIFKIYLTIGAGLSFFLTKKRVYLIL